MAGLNPSWKSGMDFLLSRPNSVEYGNSKTTTWLPSAKCTRPLFHHRHLLPLCIHSSLMNCFNKVIFLRFYNELVLPPAPCTCKVAHILTRGSIEHLVAFHVSRNRIKKVAALISAQDAALEACRSSQYCNCSTCVAVDSFLCAVYAVSLSLLLTSLSELSHCRLGVFVLCC